MCKVEMNILETNTAYFFQLHLTSAKMSEKHSRENMLMAIEREAQEKNYMLEAQLHEKQRQKQQEVSIYVALKFNYYKNFRFSSPISYSISKTKLI
jgi:hypothetical protein